MARSARHEGQVLVVGLGRFGRAMAETLEELGHEVLAVDRDPRIVQELTGRLTHVVEADSTSLEVLKQLGAADFKRAVVAIGSDIEASILTAGVLVDLGISNIWAKAITSAHGRILQRVGAHHVVFPEHDMGERVAHLVTGRMLDYMGLEDDFAMVKTVTPGELVGRTLGEADIRRRHHITVVLIKPAGGSYTFATPDTRVGKGDILVVAGQPRYAEGFAELA
jgi:trk system potassium uptake protein TrkA